MSDFKVVKVPKGGSKIGYKDGELQVPVNPIIPYFEGDGTGPDIWRATQAVLEGAVRKAFDGRREITWMKTYAGLSALQNYDKDTVLPQETLDAFREFHVAIKGPLTTPVGGFAFVCLSCAKEQDGAGGARPEACAACGSDTGRQTPCPRRNGRRSLSSVGRTRRKGYS